MISVCFSSKKGSTLKGRNLLLMEQIHSFKSGLLLKKEAEKKLAEFFPLKVYKVTIRQTFTMSETGIFMMQHILKK